MGTHSFYALSESYQTVKGFMGNPHIFKRSLIKSGSTRNGRNKVAGEARYLHGSYGYGTWTFMEVMTLKTIATMYTTLRPI